MRLISWNVNGLRAILKKGFYESLEKMQGDVFCLQEVKASEDCLPKISLENFGQVYNPACRKGYAGTAILTKIPPLSYDCNTALETLTGESEGRVIVAEYPNFYLVNIYTPNSGEQLLRLSFRHKTWDVEMLKFVLALREKKPVIICGDMNVAFQEIDLAHPESNHHSAGFTDEEREGMKNYLEYFIDSFRKFFPNKKDCYSWWSYRTRARERNIGWRIDYFLVDKRLSENLKSAFIFDDIMGSDHAPVGIDIEF